MKKDLKSDYLTILRARYKTTTENSQKSIIITELCNNTGVHRKHAIRLLNKTLVLRKQIGRKKTYSDSVLKHLKKLWFEMDQICSKKMVAAIPLWLPFYTSPDLDDKTRMLLTKITHSTIDRLLSKIRAVENTKKRTGTKPGTLLKHIIPIKPLDLNITEPGFIEADTVAHCGSSLSGEFIWTLTATDVATGWTDNRAVWHKEAKNVHCAILSIEECLPFKLRGVATDNGSEFINYILFDEYLKNSKRKDIVQFTRGRPYKKNDQCHVEQKNWTHVRQLFGYERFDKKELLQIINDIYINEWNVLQNYFVPQAKLLTKHRIGAKYKKTYDKGKTPYERVIQSHSVSTEDKEKLTKFFKTLDPFKLRKSLEVKLKYFFSKLNSVEKLDEAI